ncbi:hypothetical protein ACFTXM_30000 [Streptomyces sp. NPDC056930]|uniref:hypothetical protein n=1 Tax=Streptomyces sp. NPDC056930 TaxID=3345967 RepID=UPI00362B7CA9
MRRLAGARGTSASANARRNPRRTAATAGAVTVCVALVGAVTVALSSMSATAGREAVAALPTDLRISAVDFAEIGAEAAGRLARLPHVAAVSAVREAGFRLSDGGDLWAVAVDPVAVGRGRLADLTVRSGDLDGLPHGIAVTRKLAAEHGWRVGDRVTGGELSDAGVPDSRARCGEPQLVPRPGGVRALPVRHRPTVAFLRETGPVPGGVRADHARDAARPGPWGGADAALAGGQMCRLPP